MARIEFIGLGNMGLPMAQNLLKAGHQVEGVDVTSAATDRLKAAGGAVAQSAKLAAARADVVITMLPAGQHVREVYLGPGGIIGNAGAETLLINSSTIDVDSARVVAAAAQAKGLMMLDAPVSGGVGGATAGTLTFMVGGSASAFERALSILQVMGKTIVHAGGAGNGQAAKICNNMILGVSMIAVSEAFVLAEKLGLDKQKLFDIASKSSGPCWSMTNYCPVPGPGAGLAGEPRLPGGLHRRHDAEGPEAGAGGRKGGRRDDADGGAGGGALRSLCGPQRRGGAGFFRDHSVLAQDLTDKSQGLPAVIRSRPVRCCAGGVAAFAQILFRAGTERHPGSAGTVNRS